MDLSELKTYLDSKGDPLVLEAGDTNLPKEFQDFLKTIPTHRVTLSPGSNGIVLHGSMLTISGISSDLWPVQGMGNVSVTLTDMTLTINVEATPPTINGFAHASLPFTASVNVPVIITALQQEANPWQIKLSQSVEGLTPTEVLMLGKSGELPFDTPPDLDVLSQVLTINKDKFQITFYPNTSYEVLYSFELSAPSAKWTLIKDILSFDGIDLKAFVMTNSIFVELVSHLKIDRVGVDVRLTLSSGENWIVYVEPSQGDAFPGLAALTSWIGGSTLSGHVSNGFKSVKFDSGGFDAAIEKISLGFNWKKASLNYLDVVSLLTIGALQLDVELRLPEMEIVGSLHAQKSVKVKDMLSSFDLPTADVPDDLKITAVYFNAQPKNSYYSAGMTVDHIWTAGPVNLEEISVLVSYFGAEGFTGQFNCKLQLSEKIIVDLEAEYVDTNTGWRFSGGLEAGSNLKTGDLLSALGDKYGTSSVPQPINDLTLSHLTIAYETGTGKFMFTCEGDFEVAETAVSMTVLIDINPTSKNGTSTKYETTFSGHVLIGSLTFDLVFDHIATQSDTFLATYSHVGDQANIKLHELVAGLSNNLAEMIPPSLVINLKDVKFAFYKDASKQEKQFVFGLDITADFGLSDLPLIGDELPPNETVAVKDLQILYASQPFTEQLINPINQLMPKTVSPLPPSGIAQGFFLGAEMQFGNASLENLSLPLSSDIQPQTQPATPSPPNDKVKWFAIQKQLGPLYFEKVGVRYEKGEIWFLLNADLSLAGLTIALDGLAISSPLQKFDPRFHLQGLGIDYQDGPLEIGGMFLRQTYKDAKGEPYDEYDGIAILKTEELSLSAIGSYARLDGHPSLFIYAVLDYPLGGPAFFFVTGLSAGFGYNRFLTVPPVEQLLQFPLVSEAVSRAETAPPNSSSIAPVSADGKSSLNNMKNTLAQEMEKLHQYISPQVDQYFLAVGVRFTSFEIIDSFVLVTLAFGGRFELNIIGLTSYATPPGAEEGVPSLVRVELAIKASFLPDEGFLGVRALLTNNSYLFDPACYLVGGMAFYSWFDGPHKGDFALTVGGYHPDFHVPAHYPLVPRLGFLWHYGNQLSIKGGMYFALTGHAIMAGGSLEAVWQDGDLQAWFKTTADFLLSWKPYHYEASVSVDIGGSLTVHAFGTHYITVHLHADLSVWGPKFSGVAHFQIIGIHFSISFGDKKSVPPAIEWPAFRQSFLPQTIYGITVQSGLVKSLKGYELDDKGELVQKAGSTAVHWLLDPKDLALTINSVIPIHSWQLNGELATQFTHSVGVAPMNVRKESFTSNFEITITNDDFTFKPITKPVPAGLWGNIYAPNVNDSSMVSDTVCGFQVSLKEQADEGIGHAIEKKKLSSDTEIIQDAYQWQPTWGKTGETMAKQTTSQQIESGATDPAKQQALLQSLFSLDDTSFLRHTGKLNASDLFAHPMLVEFKD